MSVKFDEIIIGALYKLIRSVYLLKGKPICDIKLALIHPLKTLTIEVVVGNLGD